MVCSLRIRGVLLLALAACERVEPSNSVPSPRPEDTGTFTPGTCDVPSCAIVLPEPGNVALVHGPQGGWHVDLEVVTRGTGGTVFLRPSLVEVHDERLLGRTPGHGYLRALAVDGACGGRTPIRAFLDTEIFGLPAICALAGRDVRVEVDVEDLDGTSTDCSVVGAVALDPRDVEPCADHDGQ